MKNKQRSKCTYTYEHVHILLLKEAFKRDLTLLEKLLSRTQGFFTPAPFLPKGTTFTVSTDENGDSELHVNLPTEKK